jgi:hypothetical protein
MKKQPEVIDHHAYLEKTQALYDSVPTSARRYRPFFEMAISLILLVASLFFLILPFISVSFPVVFFMDQSAHFFVKFVVALLMGAVLFIFTLYKEPKWKWLNKYFELLCKKIDSMKQQYRLPYSRLLNMTPKNLRQEFLEEPYALRSMIQPQTRIRIQHWLQDPRQFGCHEIYLLNDIFEKEKNLHQQFKDYFKTSSKDHPEYLQMKALHRQLQSWENQGTLKDHQSMPYLVEQWEFLQQEHTAFQQQQQLEHETLLCNTNPVLRRL